MARLSINLKLFFAALSRILFSGGRCFGKTHYRQKTVLEATAQGRRYGMGRDMAQSRNL